MNDNHILYSKNFEKTKTEIQEQIRLMSQSPEISDKAPKLLAWYPNQLAYTFNELSRMEMRANPLLKV